MLVRVHRAVKEARVHRLLRRPADAGGRCLHGRRIIVTGASRGIGRAVAEAFASEGARLALTATRVEHLEATVATCQAAGADVRAVALELADAGGTRRAAAEAVDHLGGVDVLVNNAGVLAPHDPIADMRLEDLDEAMGLMVSGTLRLTQSVLPSLAEGGAVVTVTSGAAGAPNSGAYGLAKLVLEGASGMLRSELAERRVRCVVVDPGPVRTRLRAAARPDEDPARVPSPASVVEPFVAIAAGADPGPRVRLRRRPPAAEPAEAAPAPVGVSPPSTAPRAPAGR